jgi:hypothetical protein
VLAPVSGQCLTERTMLLIDHGISDSYRRVQRLYRHLEKASFIRLFPTRVTGVTL